LDVFLDGIPVETEVCGNIVASVALALVGWC
jgi:hypothetical protein